MTDPNAERLAAGQLRIAVGSVAHRLRQLWDSAAARDGISFTEGAILNHVQREGSSSPAELAGNGRVTSQAVTAHLSSLEARGLVRRSADPRDGRRVVVTITDAGSDALHEREGILMGSLEHALREFDGSERRILITATPLLARLAAEL